MLWLVLKTSSVSYTVGPVDSLEFRGTQIFLPRRAQAVAQYSGGAWNHMGNRCSSLDCRALLSLEFEDAAGQVDARIGPRPAFHVRDRYAFAGRQRIAHLSVVTGEWTRLDTKRACSLIRVLDSSAVTEA
jgi:hypothetical protein